MSETLRVPLVLCDMDELSYQEIAEELGIGMSATKMRIKRGREEFRRLYEDLFGTAWPCEIRSGPDCDTRPNRAVIRTWQTDDQYGDEGPAGPRSADCACWQITRCPRPTSLQATRSVGRSFVVPWPVTSRAFAAWGPWAALLELLAGDLRDAQGTTLPVTNDEEA